MIAIFIAAFYYDVLLGLRDKEKSMKLFHVLTGFDGMMLSSSMVISSTTAIKQAIASGNVVCDESISTLKQGIVSYIYLCTLDEVKINPEVKARGEYGYKPMKHILPIGIVESETGNHTVSFFSGNYVKVYSKVFSLEVVIPEDAKQGLIKAFESDDEDYYLISNIPYIYFKARYIDGLGNASLIIRAVFSINDVNLTYPLIIEYYLNTNVEAFLSPIETPISRSFIEEKAKVLTPLLDINGGRKVKLKYYVDVFIKSSGKYQLKLAIGYLGVRIVES